MKPLHKTYSMILIICLYLGPQTLLANREQRVFTAANGQSIVGQLQRYNPLDQSATIRRADGKVYCVAIERFSEPDQRYIQLHGVVVELTDLHLHMELRQYAPSPKNRPRRAVKGDVSALGYVIALNNQTHAAFAQIDIEYCVFYWQGSRHKQTWVRDHGVRYGRWTRPALAAGTTETFVTRKILIEQEASTCTMFGETGGAFGNIDGIWIRVAAVLPNGETHTREIRSPTLTDVHAWTPADVPVGLNDRSAQSALNSAVRQLGIP